MVLLLRPRLVFFCMACSPAVFLQVLVKLLYIPTGKFVQLDVADARDRVLLDASSVIIRCGGTNVRLGVQLEPEPKPLRDRVLISAGDVQLFAFLYRTSQLLFDLCLCLSQHVLANPLAGLGIVPGCIASLPSPVCAFANAALAIKEPHSGTQVPKRELHVVLILLSILFLSLELDRLLNMSQLTGIKLFQHLLNGMNRVV